MSIAYTVRYRIPGDRRTLEQSACMVSHQSLEELRASMTEYELLQILAADACERCQGQGQIKNGRRKGPLMAFKVCPACKGVAYLNERVIELEPDPTPALLRHPITLSQGKRASAVAYGRLAIACIAFHVETGQLAELDGAYHYTREAIRRAEGR